MKLFGRGVAWGLLIAMGAELVPGVKVFGEDASTPPPPPTAISSSPAMTAATTPSATAPATRPAFTLGRKTTRIMEPLLPDGRPDYVTALDQAMSKGVTPENNVLVGMLEVLGTGNAMIPGKIHDEALKRLGINEEKTASFQNLKEYLKTQGKEDDAEIDNLKGQLSKQPWDPEEYELFAQWLTENNAALDQMVQFSLRDHYYWPLIATTDKAAMISVLLPSLGSCRELANALTIRAMLRLQQGKIAESQADLLAVHRLGRLVSQGTTLIERLVAISMESLAARGDAQLAEFVTPAQAKAYLAELDKLPPMGNMAQAVDVAERYMGLDAVLSVSKYGLGCISEGSGGPESPNTHMNVLIPGIDWNSILLKFNGFYDRMVAVMNLPTYAERKAATKTWEDKLQANSNNFIWNLDPTEKVGNMLLNILMPSLSRARVMSDRGQEEGELSKVAFGLAAYHGDKGSFPEKLEDLAPAYLKQIPLDIFADAPLKYHREGEGYLLYSVGPNQQDDGGNGVTDYNKGDIIVAKTK